MADEIDVRLADELDQQEFIKALENLEIDPSQFEPGAGTPHISSGDFDEEFVTTNLCQMLQSHDAAVEPRHERYIEIENAYNLLPNTERQGWKPDASRLVSEHTRASCKTGTAMLTEPLLGAKDLLMVNVCDDQDDSEETDELVETAKDIRTFLDCYTKNHMNRDRHLFNSIQNLTKLGNSRIRALWSIEKKQYRYLGKDGKVKEREEKVGGVTWDEIPIRSCFSWPIEETDLQKCILVGHRSILEEFELRAKLRDLGMEPAEIDKLTGKSPDNAHDEDRERALEGKDIQISDEAPLGGSYQLTECWGYMPLKKDGEAVKFQAFLYEPKQQLIWLDFNYLFYQTIPYFDLAYWRETDTIYSTGVGQEAMYPQAADTALWNMNIDNLKVIGNALRVIKAGSTAEAMRDQIAPGFDLITENPGEDVALHPLGGDLSELYRAQDKNDQRLARATAISAPASGFADPILKSGASPGSYQQLLEQTSKTFKLSDTGIRIDLSDLFMHILELVQQYAPEGMFYTVLGEQSADRLRRIKFMPPRGDLRSLYRIGIRPPSAASNREQMRMNLMLIYNLSTQQVQMVSQLAQATYAKFDPGKIFRLQQDWLRYLGELYREIVEIHDVPGLTAMAPKTDDTDADQLIDQLFRTMAEMQKELESAQQQAAAAAGQQPQLEGVGGQPGVPTPFPV